MAKAKTGKSSSRGIKVTSGGPLEALRRERRTAADDKTHREAADRLRAKMYQGLSNDGRSRYTGLGEGPSTFPASTSQPPDSTSQSSSSAPPLPYDALFSIPPGEEGYYESHEGGEAALLDEILQPSASVKRARDSRDRRDRRLRQTADWAAQMEKLADAYLEHRANLCPPVDTTAGGAWRVTAIDFTHHESRIMYSGTGKDVPYPNVVLLRRGYLGSSPTVPTVAISLTVLEHYHRAFLTCPRFSVQAQVKALCRMHNMRYTRYLRTQFREAYDVYLAVRRVVKGRIDARLGRNVPNYRMLNSCPPCTYTLQEDPTLHPSMQVCMDGNQSLKLIDEHYRNGEFLPDLRDGRSEIWITPEEVDLFKNEVASARAAAGATAVEQALVDEDEDEGEWEDIDNAEESSECVRRWKTAAPEAKKRMFTLFAVTGVFISICRHGHLLTICDMVRSGEMMKYPLATINRLINVYGSDVMWAYDIACLLQRILARSSLGPAAEQAGMKPVVPAFHGHAHNRLCQLHWHLLYTNGAGKEEFEGSERVFSLSNPLATTTRFATAFHRHQAIDEYFVHWDEEKLETTGDFLYNNYRQCLKIIKNDNATLQANREAFGLTDADFERFIDEEVQYLESLTTERDDIVQTIEYMEALQNLQVAQLEAEVAYNEYLRLDDLIINHGYQRKQIAAVKSRANRAQSKFLELSEATRRLEIMYDIGERWTPQSPEYQNGLVLLHERRYRRALDKLERLIVQRLFELTKLGMSGVGYKMREKITKALKMRAAAIRRALDDYNKQAAALQPPRQQLLWSDILSMVSVGEFDLLRDTDGQLLNRDWARPGPRAAANLYFNVKRAREELVRVNVEMRRLVTFMHDSHADYIQAIDTLRPINPALAHAIHEEFVYRSSVYDGLAARLHDTSRLRGFKGNLERGQRIGRAQPVNNTPPPPWLHHLRLAVQTVEPDALSDGDESDDEADSHDNRRREVTLHFLDGATS